MKDYTERSLRESRPDVDALETIKFCLVCFFRDKKHRLADKVVKNLTYSELIGALLLAEDYMSEIEK